MTIENGQPMVADDFLKNHTDPTNPGNDENKGVKLNENGVIEYEFLDRKFIEYWKSGRSYIINDLIAYSGAIYKALKDMVSIIAPPGDYESVLINDNNSISYADDGSDYKFQSIFSDDGTLLFTPQRSSYVKVSELNTPFDASSIASSTNISIPDLGDNADYIRFYQNGSVCFIKEGGDYTVYKYTLSTPFDLTTATLEASNSVNEGGFDISLDGRFIYLVDDDLDYIRQYEMTTPWDITTTNFYSYISNSYSLTDIKISKNGEYAIFSSRYNSDGYVYQFELSTPFDISTMSYMQNDYVDTDSSYGIDVKDKIILLNGYDSSNGIKQVNYTDTIGLEWEKITN